MATKPFYAYELCLETNEITLGAGQQTVPPRRYKLIGRNTTDSFTNKTITDPSNNVAASNLIINNTINPILPGGATGDVLTKTADGVQFLPGGGGGGAAGSYDIVRIPATAFANTGTNYYLVLGAPVDILGSSASTITVQAATDTPVGSEIICSKVLFLVNSLVCTQSPSQGAARRASVAIVSNGVTGADCDNTIPAGINAFRLSLRAIEYGKAAGTKIAVRVSSNVVAAIVFQGGYIDVAVVV